MATVPLVPGDGGDGEAVAPAACRASLSLARTLIALAVLSSAMLAGVSSTASGGRFAAVTVNVAV